MPNVCHTCDLPRRAYIDRQALSGRPLLAIAKELRVSYHSLRGHVRGGHHLPGYVPGHPIPLAPVRPSTNGVHPEALLPVPRPLGPHSVEQALWDFIAGIYLQALAAGVPEGTATWNEIIDVAFPPEEPEWFAAGGGRGDAWAATFSGRLLASSPAISRPIGPRELQEALAQRSPGLEPTEAEIRVLVKELTGTAVGPFLPSRVPELLDRLRGLVRRRRGQYQLG